MRLLTASEYHGAHDVQDTRLSSLLTWMPFLPLSVVREDFLPEHLPISLEKRPDTIWKAVGGQLPTEEEVTHSQLPTGKRNFKHETKHIRQSWG